MCVHVVVQVWRDIVSIHDVQVCNFVVIASLKRNIKLCILLSPPIFTCIFYVISILHPSPSLLFNNMEERTKEAVVPSSQHPTCRILIECFTILSQSFVRSKCIMVNTCDCRNFWMWIFCLKFATVRIDLLSSRLFIRLFTHWWSSWALTEQSHKSENL